MQRLAMALLLVMCISCAPPKQREPQYKYLISVGSAAFSLGYGVDSFERVDGLIKFKTAATGREFMIPEDQILSIEKVR